MLRVRAKKYFVLAIQNHVCIHNYATHIRMFHIHVPNASPIKLNLFFHLSFTANTSGNLTKLNSTKTIVFVSYLSRGTVHQ